MSSDNPLVSVCIPAYNCENYIGKAINCLLAQTHENLEIIVVNDGSTDGTGHILKSIAHKRFQWVVQDNRGAAAARNKAYQLSSGEFIKFMDADDLLNVNCIASQLDKIKNKPGCIASAKWGRFYADDLSDFKLAPEKTWKDSRGIDWLVNSLVDAGSNMTQPGIFLIPRSVIETVGPWNEELSLMDDFEFMTRVIANCVEVLFCADAILLYRSGLGNNLSAKKSAIHMNSAFDSVGLGVQKILETRNDSRARLACANTYQRWAYQFYPYHNDLCNKAEMQIRGLGGSNLNLGGGSLILLLEKLIGWKGVKRVKILIKENSRDKNTLV